MCGRFTLSVPIDDLAGHFGIVDPPFDERPRFNIAPTQSVPIVRLGPEGERELVLAHWGLIPSWAKDRKIGNKMINARAETVTSKPAFRSAFKRRRCLIPADGFYEWRHTGSAKTPFWIGMKDHGLFAFAGLWEGWTDQGPGDHVDSCTIITTDSNDLVREIHDRMPVILSSSDYETWMVPDTPPQDLQTLLKPFDPKAMACYEVSKAVNSPKNNSPDLVAPVPSSK